MLPITPNVWCRGDAVEVARFLADALPDTSWRVTARYPASELPDFQRRFAGAPLVVDVTVAGCPVRLINAGDEFRPTPALSFQIIVDPVRTPGGAEGARALVRRIWDALAADGEVRMPLGEYPFSALYGWVQDRYGVNWQPLLADPATGPRPFLVPQLTFTGVEPQAAAAVDVYTGLFPDSSVDAAVPHPDAAHGLAFGAFTLAGRPFCAMDAGADHVFTFTPGVSLQVDCVDQAEIDRLWNALSAVPEAEQCGWLVDRFGVSWQIVPAAMGTLLERPGAYRRLLGMTRIVIDEL